METSCFDEPGRAFSRGVAGEGLVREVWPGDRVPQHRSSPQEQLANGSDRKGTSGERIDLRMEGKKSPIQGGQELQIPREQIGF